MMNEQLPEDNPMAPIVHMLVNGNKCILPDHESAIKLEEELTEFCEDNKVNIQILRTELEEGAFIRAKLV